LHSWVYFPLIEPNLTFLTRVTLLTRHCSNYREKPYHEERQTTVLDDGGCANLEDTCPEENPCRQNREDA
jgi:hypothetical protein